MKAVLSIPARMKSARLPGKVLAPIEAGGETHAMLWYQVQRLRKSSAEVVIATTEEPEDDAIANAARAWGVRCVRGSTNDLIARHAKVARETDCDVFVLSGADDPLLEVDAVNWVAGMVAANYGVTRYAFTSGYPLGMNCWAWDRDGMEEADAKANDADEREHVVPWFARRPERYPAAETYPEHSFYETHRLTVDFPVDLELVRRIFAELWPVNHDFTLRDILRLLDKHPHWVALNNRAPQYFYDLTPVDEGVKA